MHDRKYYPPKYLISIANKFRNDEEWDSDDFSGGPEANQFLKSMGFEIVSGGTKANRPSSIFGEIPNVKVGQVFSSREELGQAGIHAPTMAGIWGASEGAYPIVLSGGYEDDIDDLNYVLYTGQGGFGSDPHRL